MARQPAAAAVQAAKRWELWFPQRLGPRRKHTATIGGVKVTGTARIFEFPPSANDRLHFRVKGPWIKEWRDFAKDIAKAAKVPPLERIRISAVVYRRALGVADEDNDRGRLKPLVDGLRDAKVIQKDTRDFIEYGHVIELHADQRGTGILLIVEELS